MEKKAYPPKQQDKSRKTLFGVIFKALFMLILLSMVSWMFLVGWFSLQAVFTKNYSAYSHIQVILESQLRFISYHSQPSLKAFLEYLKNSQYTFHSAFDYMVGAKIGENITDIVLGAVEIIAVRIGTFINALPFLVITLSVFVIDGFVQRDIRKFQGQRESTLFFHSLKPLVGMSFFSLFLLFMAMPFVVKPQIFFILMAIVSGMFVMFSIKSFKKYM